jgi:two-component system chemotaxis sensor kinase CheA
MDAELEKVIATFEAQTWDGLASMEESLLELETRPGDAELLNRVFRICHTLKGDADSLGFAALTEFAHVLEDLLGRLRAGTLAMTDEILARLLGSVDVLRDLLSDVLEGRDELSSVHRRLLDELRRTTTDEVGVLPEGPATPAAPSEPVLPRRVAAPTLRIRVETLDRLMNLAGELSIARGRLDQAVLERGAWIGPELVEAHRAMDHLFANLQEEVMRVRMVPLGPVFRQHVRGVRELAVAHGKRARLEIHGEDAEIDTTVIEHLREALIHVIRNAVAHGIELPERRIARGKEAVGRIALSARQEGAQIVVEVSDDGEGVDVEAVRRRARTLGLADDPDALGQDELLELVFHPGFSTQDEATLAAGRGVGMDAVRRSIEAAGGSVSLSSVGGSGTVTMLRLPLTLAIIDGFAVGVGDEVFVLPLAAVVECLDLPVDGHYARGGATGLMSVRGKPLSWVRLGYALALACPPGRRPSVVVVEHAGQRLGLVVDALHGERQAVIKPLARHLRHVPEIAGSTILGDGRIALILDVRALIERAADPQQALARFHPTQQAGEVGHV